jgi:hypothetical protein
VEEIVIMSLRCERSLGWKICHAGPQENGGIDELIHRRNENAAGWDMRLHIHVPFCTVFFPHRAFQLNRRNNILHKFALTPSVVSSPEHGT